MRFVVVLTFIATPAIADQLSYEDTPAGEQIGVLHYLNEETYFDSAETIETTIQTPHGPIALLTARTQNNLCDPACADMLEVISTPDGTIAVPGVVELPESGRAEVRILPWRGM